METIDQPIAITITPEQIIAAAQEIVNSHDDAWEHSADEYIAATEHWLRCAINLMLVDANWYANQDDSQFSLSHKCQWPGCHDAALADSPYCEMHDGWRRRPESATGVVMPEPPAWAHDSIQPATAE